MPARVRGEGRFCSLVVDRLGCRHPAWFLVVFAERARLRQFSSGIQRFRALRSTCCKHMGGTRFSYGDAESSILLGPFQSGIGTACTSVGILARSQVVHAASGNLPGCVGTDCLFDCASVGRDDPGSGDVGNRISGLSRTEPIELELLLWLAPGESGPSAPVSDSSLVVARPTNGIVCGRLVGLQFS